MEFWKMNGAGNDFIVTFKQTLNCDIALTEYRSHSSERTFNAGKSDKIH